MFPSPARRPPIAHFLVENNQRQQRGKDYKSAQLPYFRRFPNNRFVSQQKKRHNLNDSSPNQQRPAQSYSNPTIRNKKKLIPNKPEQRIGLLQPHHPHTEQKRDSAEKKIEIFQTYSNKNESPSNSILHRRTSRIKPKIIKNQLGDRQGTKIKQRTQETADIKVSVSSIMKNKIQKLGHCMKVSQVIQNHKTKLSDFQIGEILSYSQIFYFGQNCVAKKKINLSEMTKQDGAYIWIKGDHIAYRYEIFEELGQGSFGQVLKCFDHKRKTNVAVKLVKDNQRYTHQAKTQIKILQTIKTKDPLSSKNCIQIRENFMFRNRMCIIFDLLSLNLYQLTRNNGYYGFPLDLIRRFCLQILNAIYFLHKNKIIHADLKPENILLKESNKSGLKIIDFGSSCFEGETIYTYIQSRYYRAPQVILGLPYNRKIDIWSFGCIAAELHLGYPIFAGQDEHQQICFLVQVLGFPPEQLKKNAKRWPIFFDNNMQLKSNQKNILPNSKSLNQSLENVEDDFVDFIRICFRWNLQQRAQSLDLLKHEWILKGLPEQILKQHLNFIKQEQKFFTNEASIDSKKIRKFSIRGRKADRKDDQ